MVSESWQDRCQIVADRQPESAATLDYGEDGGDLWSSLCAADVDPWKLGWIDGDIKLETIGGKKR